MLWHVYDCLCPDVAVADSAGHVEGVGAVGGGGDADGADVPSTPLGSVLIHFHFRLNILNNYKMLNVN